MVSTCAIKLQGLGSHQYFASSWKSLALGVLVDLTFLIGVGGVTKMTSFSKKTPGKESAVKRWAPNRRCAQLRQG